MSTTLRPTLVLLLLLTGLTGGLYPALVTAAAQALFPHQANGSLVVQGGRVVGSELIGQPFTGAGEFHSRPSATGYQTSGGANLGPTHPALTERVAASVAALHLSDPAPVDLVTRSASGLDPHLSPAAALAQVPRVAKARGLEEAALKAIVLAHVEAPTLGLFGAPRISVLRLNQALSDP